MVVVGVGVIVVSSSVARLLSSADVLMTIDVIVSSSTCGLVMYSVTVLVIVEAVVVVMTEVIVADTSTAGAEELLANKSVDSQTVVMLVGAEVVAVLGGRLLHFDVS